MSKDAPTIETVRALVSSSATREAPEGALALDQ